jgi:hypothetical protein
MDRFIGEQAVTAIEQEFGKPILLRFGDQYCTGLDRQRVRVGGACCSWHGCVPSMTMDAACEAPGVLIGDPPGDPAGTDGLRI